MTEAHKRAYRHPPDKATYGVQNWRAYNKSLRDRGAEHALAHHEASDAWRKGVGMIGIECCLTNHDIIDPHHPAGHTSAFSPPMDSSPNTSVHDGICCLRLTTAKR